MLPVALIAALLGPPDVGVVADVAEQRAAELGRNHLTSEQAGRIARAAVASSRQFRIPVPLIFAVIESESAYGLGEVSSASCKGLMQLNPSSVPAFRRMAGLGRHASITNIEDNIAMGTSYIRYLWDRYGRLDHAISAYNRGEGKFESQGKPVGRYAHSVLKRLPLLGSLLVPKLNPDLGLTTVADTE